MRFKEAIKSFFITLRGEKKEELSKATADTSHVQLLYLLQKSSRLIDFLAEDLSTFSDAQIGGAVRQIQSESQRCLKEWVGLKPIFEEPEGAEISLPANFNPAEVKIVGKVSHRGPYQGILRHKGWKAEKARLEIESLSNVQVIAPAEVEIKGN